MLEIRMQPSEISDAFISLLGSLIFFIAASLLSKPKKFHVPPQDHDLGATIRQSFYPTILHHSKLLRRFNQTFTLQRSSHTSNHLSDTGLQQLKIIRSGIEASKKDILGHVFFVLCLLSDHHQP